MVSVPHVNAGEPALHVHDVAAAKMGLRIKPGYMFREANWEIGRAPERAGIVAPVFNRKNRWLAWRRRQARVQQAAQMKSIRSQNKSSKKKKGGRR